jgi:hypothetical protein
MEQKSPRMPSSAAMFSAWVDSVQRDALRRCPGKQKQVLKDVLSELVQDVEMQDEDSMEGRRLSEYVGQADLDRRSAAA